MGKPLLLHQKITRTVMSFWRCYGEVAATLRRLFTMQIKFAADLPQTTDIHIQLMVNFWRSSPQLTRIVAKLRRTSPKVHHKLYMDVNCLRQVCGELNLHGKKSLKGCRKQFAATLPQSLRQICRSSSPEAQFFGKGYASSKTRILQRLYIIY